MKSRISIKILSVTNHQLKKEYKEFVCIFEIMKKYTIENKRTNDREKTKT